MQWSVYQENIFSFMAQGAGNALIKAVAGSGKTSTLIEGIKRANVVNNIMLAFNKSIASELTAKGVNGRTFHSLTYGPVTRAYGVRDVDTNKTRTIMKEVMTEKEGFMYGKFVSQLVGLSKQFGMGFLVNNTLDSWMDIVDHHALELDTDYGDIGRGVELAAKVLEASNNSKVLDFDDLLYFAVKDGIKLPSFDMVLVDEAQDTNSIQRMILHKICAGRLIAVGDPCQAIYGFRGSDSNSMDLIKAEFDCQELPLTVSYRCPIAIVEHARQWVTHIEPSPNAPQGEVIDYEFDWESKIIKPFDMVVCRTTRPLVALAYEMIAAKGTAPVILGRDIGKGMVRLIEKMRANNIDELEHNLTLWRDKEVEKAKVKMREDKIDAIYDQYETVMFLIGQGHRTIPELIQSIDVLFADKANAATLCTIHKSKGLEADNVFWLNSSQCPSKRVRRDWQKQQEINLCYVATTRSKRTLHLIER